MPRVEKKEVIQSAVVFIFTALLTYYLDTRGHNEMVKHTNDYIGLAKACFYHQTGRRPEGGDRASCE